MHGPAPRSAWTASARSAWASEALAQASSSSLPTSMSPAPSAWNSSLAASTTCWRTWGKPWLTSRVVRVPMLLARAAGSMRIALVLPAWMIPSQEGPRLAGSEGARPDHPPAAGVTGAEHSSTSAWRRRRAALGWPQVRREGPGWRPRDDRGGATPDPDRVLPPEAATPARATLGEAGQQPPEHLPNEPLPSTAAHRWYRSGCGHPGSARATASRVMSTVTSTLCRPPSCGRGPLGTASSWLLSPSPARPRSGLPATWPRRCVRVACRSPCVRRRVGLGHWASDLRSMTMRAGFGM